MNLDFKECSLQLGISISSHSLDLDLRESILGWGLDLKGLVLVYPFSEMSGFGLNLDLSDSASKIKFFLNKCFFCKTTW